MATRRQCQHPVPGLCCGLVSQAAESSSGSRTHRAGLHLDPPGMLLVTSPLWHAKECEWKKPSVLSPGFYFANYWHLSMEENTVAFFTCFVSSAIFFLHFPVQWRVCEGKKNEVPALAFLKKGSPAALFRISHHKSV